MAKLPRIPARLKKIFELESEKRRRRYGWIGDGRCSRDPYVLGHQVNDDANAELRRRVDEFYFPTWSKSGLPAAVFAEWLESIKQEVIDNMPKLEWLDETFLPAIKAQLNQQAANWLDRALDAEIKRRRQPMDAKGSGKKRTAHMPIVPTGAAESSNRVPPKSETEQRRSYRVEIETWMVAHDIYTVKDAAKSLAVSYDILKNMMTTKGTRRYGAATLDDVLKKIRVRTTT